MLTNVSNDDYPSIDPDAVAERINRLAPGERLTLIGRDLAGLRDLLIHAPDQARHLLLLDLATATTADAAIARMLDDLADLALAVWPDWSASDEGPTPWRRAAERLATAGLRPRFRRLPGEIELPRLLQIIDQNGVVLVAAVDALRSGSAAAVVAALEWALRHGAAVVAVLSDRPTAFAPYDRILYGALEIAAAPMPAVRRTILPSAVVGSNTERKVRRALAADPELGPLFESEVTIQLGPLKLAPRVDLCWRNGRVIVELDGPEHFGDPTYGLDRHRDYELLMAGYLVLRLTNAQVATDLPQAIEKIRSVVRLRSLQESRS